MVLSFAWLASSTRVGFHRRTACVGEMSSSASSFAADRERASPAGQNPGHRIDERTAKAGSRMAQLSG